MNKYVLAAIIIALFLLAGQVSGQEPVEVITQNTSTTNTSTAAPQAIDIAGVITVLIFFVTVLLIIVFSARSYSNTSKTLFEKALEKNKELPEELQESVSDIIRAFPQAEPLGLPRGSLRAIVMLIFSFAFVFLLLFPQKQITGTTTTLGIIVSVLVGFYFGSRYAEARIMRTEASKRETRIQEPQEVKEAEIKEITPAGALFEEKREEKKKRKKREGLI